MVHIRTFVVCGLELYAVPVSPPSSAGGEKTTFKDCASYTSTETDVGRPGTVIGLAGSGATCVSGDEDMMDVVQQELLLKSWPTMQLRYSPGGTRNVFTGPDLGLKVVERHFVESYPVVLLGWSCREQRDVLTFGS